VDLALVVLPNRDLLAVIVDDTTAPFARRAMDSMGLAVEPPRFKDCG
jgi:hypothetical protein